MIVGISELLNDGKLFEKFLLSLENSEPFVFPTDTVYGIGCFWGDDRGEKRIYELKNRPFDKKLTVYVRGAGDLNSLGVNSGVVESLFERFLPGPLMIICDSSYCGSIGVRFPAHKYLAKLLKRLPRLICGTSANYSGASPASSFSEAVAYFGGEIPFILHDEVISNKIKNSFDKKDKNSSLSSTIVSVSGAKVSILRRGPLYDEVKEYLMKNGAEFSEKKNILVVCTGNTCRSPMLEKYLRAYFDKIGLGDKYSVSSCGIYAPFSISASNDAVEVLKEEGLDLSSHKSRNITNDMVKNADKIIVMTIDHKVAIEQIDPSASGKIAVLNVNDPIGMGKETYKRTFNEIKEKVENIKDWLLE